MEQKVKFIIAALIGISLVCAFLFVSASSSKQQILRERDELQTQNANLKQDLSKLENNIRSAQSKITSLKDELEKGVQEKREFETKYNTIKAEKDELVAKLKFQKTEQPSRTQISESVPSQTPDSYWAGVLKAKKDLEFQLDTMRDELRTLQVANEQLQKDKSSLELDINAFRREKEELARQLDYNTKLMDSIAQEVVRERNSKVQMQDSIKTLKEDNLYLTRQLKSLLNRKVSLERKIHSLDEKKETLERRLSDMEAMLDTKTSQINDLKQQVDVSLDMRSGKQKESVELPPIVVHSSGTQKQESSPNSNPNAKGKVLALNRENNFVIIDLGEDSGVKIGESFKIYREDKIIAIVEVIQARKNISACDIKQQNDIVKIGDLVR